MAKKAVVDAVMARLEENFSTCPVMQPNAAPDDVPKGDVLWVQVQYPAATVRQRDLAGKHYREEGTVRFIVNGVRDAGLDPALAVAEELAELFTGRRFGDPRVQTYEANSPPIANQNDQGTAFQLPLTVRYTYDFRTA